MKFFDIPTDSLYKFMALSGLAMIIVSYVPAYQGIKEGEGLEEIQSKIELFVIETRWAMEDINSINNQIEILVRKLSKLTGVSDSDIKKALYSNLPLDKTRKDLEEHKIIWDELETKASEKRKLSREYETKRHQYKTYFAMELSRSKIQLILFLFSAIDGLLLGFPLAISGFVLWYKKLQVPQDLLIQKKLLE